MLSAENLNVEQKYFDFSPITVNLCSSHFQNHQGKVVESGTYNNVSSTITRYLGTVEQSDERNDVTREHNQSKQWILEQHASRELDVEEQETLSTYSGLLNKEVVLMLLSY